jgi:hypothetical protein
MQLWMRVAHDGYTEIETGITDFTFSLNSSLKVERNS